MKAHHHFSDPEWDGEPIEPKLKISIPRSQTPPPPQRTRTLKKPHPGFTATMSISADMP